MSIFTAPSRDFCVSLFWWDYFGTFLRCGGGVKYRKVTTLECWNWAQDVEGSPLFECFKCSKVTALECWNWTKVFSLPRESPMCRQFYISWHLSKRLQMQRKCVSLEKHSRHRFGCSQILDRFPNSKLLCYWMTLCINFIII